MKVQMTFYRQEDPKNLKILIGTIIFNFFINKKEIPLRFFKDTLGITVLF